MLNVLQGQILGWEERRELAQIVASLPIQNKKKLIDFIEGTVIIFLFLSIHNQSIQKGASDSAVENNACKVFQCTPSQLGDILEREDGVDQLTEHFQVRELPDTNSSFIHFRL